MAATECPICERQFLPGEYRIDIYQQDAGGNVYGRRRVHLNCVLTNRDRS